MLNFLWFLQAKWCNITSFLTRNLRLASAGVIFFESLPPKYRDILCYVTTGEFFRKDNTAAVSAVYKNKITKLFSTHLNPVHETTRTVHTHIMGSKSGAAVRGMQYTTEGVHCGRGRCRAINPNDADKLSSPAVSSHARASLPSPSPSVPVASAAVAAAVATTRKLRRLPRRQIIRGKGGWARAVVRGGWERPQYGTAFWQPRPSSGRHERIIFYPHPTKTMYANIAPDVYTHTHTRTHK